MNELLLLIASPILIGLAAYIMGGACIKDAEAKELPERRERTGEDFYNDLKAEVKQ